MYVHIAVLQETLQLTAHPSHPFTLPKFVRLISKIFTGGPCASPCVNVRTEPCGLGYGGINRVDSMTSYDGSESAEIQV